MLLDLHVHTKEISPCGRVGAKDLVRLYKQKGFSGIVITDHYRKDFFTNRSDKENVRAFLEGFYAAKAEGEKAGLCVYLGTELKLNENPYNEYLLYGIDEAFLYAFPRIFELPLADVHKIAADYGAVLIQAHPYRNGKCFPRDIGDVDGYEVFNGHFCHINDNDRAAKLSAERGGIQTAGSDAHTLFDIANAGIVCDSLPTQRDLGAFLCQNPELYKTPMQHFTAAFSADCAEKTIKTINNLENIDAFFSKAPKDKTEKIRIPAFSFGDTFIKEFSENRYTVLANHAVSDPFNPSICLMDSKNAPKNGSANILFGKEFQIDRTESQFFVTVPESGITVLEFNGFRPREILRRETD